MTEQAAKNARLNLRASEEALTTIKEAAALQGQDVTSFVMGAALERARGVLAEDRLLKLTPEGVLQLERALDREPQVVPQLARLFEKYGARDVEPAGRKRCHARVRMEDAR